MLTFRVGNMSPPVFLLGSLCALYFEASPGNVFPRFSSNTTHCPLRFLPITLMENPFLASWG